MSVWSFVPGTHSPALHGSQGELVSVSVTVEPRDLEDFLEALAALYAIGVIGAVAINVTLCSLHPRLRRMHRKVPMLMLGFILLAIWVTLAGTLGLLAGARMLQADTGTPPAQRRRRPPPTS